VGYYAPKDSKFVSIEPKLEPVVGVDNVTYVKDYTPELLAYQADIKDGTLTIKNGDNTLGTFSSNQDNDKSIDISSELFSGDYNDLDNPPTNLSEFTNDEGFVTTDTTYTNGDGLKLSSGAFSIDDNYFGSAAFKNTSYFQQKLSAGAGIDISGSNVISMKWAQNDW